MGADVTVLKYAATTLLLLLNTACFSARPLQPTLTPVEAACVICTDTLHVDFLGVSGFVLQWRGHTIITGPLVTNPPLDEIIANNPIRTNEQLVDRAVAPVETAVRAASAILIGHGHYDHLMDVPYVAGAYARDARIYGNETVGRLLRFDEQLASRVVSIPADSVSTTGRQGVSFTLDGGAIRVFPLLSEHPPNIKVAALTYTIAPGEADSTARRQPNRPQDWAAGTTYAYLIDFMRDDGTIAFRVHYADAAHSAPIGLPPATPAFERPVDLAILCAGNYRNAVDYPSAVLERLRPRNIIVGHWENFFKSRYAEPIEPIPGEDYRALAAALDSYAQQAHARWMTPLPGAHITIIN